MKIAPSILTADFCELGKTIDMLSQSSAEIIHIDVMDGVFVPNISIGFPVIKSIRSRTQKALDVHLMIVEPERYIDRVAEMGVEYISVHIEACNAIPETLGKIRAAGIRAGLVLNPETPVESVFPYIYLCDFVLLMSVHPGFGGQKFIPETLNKIRSLRGEADRQSLKLDIEVDGGINLTNAAALREAGATILVAGNTVLSSPTPFETINALRQ